MSQKDKNSDREDVAMQSIVLTEEERKAAYAWLARRDGNATAETEASFQRWLWQNPRNRRAYDEASRLWEMLGAPAAAVAGECRAPETRYRRKAVFAPFAVAASIILMACFALWLTTSNIMQDWRADVTTAYGEIQDFQLPDGSTVTLAPDTALALNFVAGERRDVEILRGEAFFEVRHGLPAPFIVEAGEGRVEVTGTAFDVDLIHDDVTVIVETGSVKVSGRTENAALLSASEKVEIDDGIPGPVQSVEPGLEPGWMKGQVSFDRQPVGKVMATLQRYLPARIVTRGEIGERVVSGSFPTDDPEQALQAVADAVNARVIHVTPWIIMIF